MNRKSSSHSAARRLLGNRVTPLAFHKGGVLSVSLRETCPAQVLGSCCRRPVRRGGCPVTRRKTATTASLPSEVTNVRHWRTREDPFSTVWEKVRQQIEENPGLEAKTLFEWLQREYPGQYQDGQIRTLQRRIKPRGRFYCHMFEMPIIRAVGIYSH